MTGIHNFTWKFYIIFAVLNAFWLPWIYFFYVETAGLSLDELDRVFENKFAPGVDMTYKETTKLAKEQMEEGRHVLGDSSMTVSEEKAAVEYLEQEV